MEIVEVGPRDGLQNAPHSYPTQAKVAFIEALVDAGVRTIEATSFVSPAAVPKMADAGQVMRRLKRVEGVRYLALVPNERGYDRATETGVNAIALFASATERFNEANLRATIDQTFERFRPISRRARADNIWLRGYISVAFACPYSGNVHPGQVRSVALRLLDLGCDEIALADTIGTASPGDVHNLLDAVEGVIPPGRIALHLHDTAGRAIANVDAARERGISIFDSAAGGLGGCPFAPGAPGNLATEQLVEHLHRQDIATGIDSNAVRCAVAGLDAERLQPSGPAR